MNKILILTNSIEGLFSFRKEVVKAILSKGYKVYISVPKGDSDKEDFFISLGCTIEYQIIDRRGTNPLNDFKLFFNYNKLIKRIKPSLILSYTIKPNIYGGFAARFNKIPQLANITGLGSSINNKGITQKIAVALYKMGLSQTYTVFYQNISIKEFCIENQIGRKGLLLPGSGVDLNWHHFYKYPENDNPIKFLFIGRIMKDKGIDEFIVMLKYIKSKYSNTEFHILGNCEENYQATLQELMRSGLLYWHGAVQDVRPYIKNSHCTILPSYHEGMANVLLESCAAGRPIIASNINGCKEAIDDEINGYLCKVKDSLDLIDKVEKFIKLPNSIKSEMGEAARKKVETEFDRKIIIDAYLKEIETIMR